MDKTISYSEYISRIWAFISDRGTLTRSVILHKFGYQSKDIINVVLANFELEGRIVITEETYGSRKIVRIRSI